MNQRLTDTQREQLESIFSHGLIGGLGDEQQTCLEGAISLVMDGELTDTPSCVAEADRDYGVAINDANWSSPAARADALLPLALAQVGTAGTDRSAWVRRLTEGTIRRVLPLVYDATAELYAEPHASALRDAAERCRRVRGGEAARAAAYAANANDSAAASARVAALAAELAAYAPTLAAAYAASAAGAASDAATVHASAAARRSACDAVLRESVAVALDAYREEGR